MNENLKNRSEWNALRETVPNRKLELAKRLAATWQKKVVAARKKTGLSGVSKNVYRLTHASDILTEDSNMNPDPAALAKLWPNRTHESNWLKATLCALGLHRWHPLEITHANTTIECTFCRWCPKVKTHQ
jgi:hypothetical protein